MKLKTAPAIARPKTPAAAPDRSSQPSAHLHFSGWNSFTPASPPGIQVVISTHNNAATIGRALYALAASLQGFRWVLLLGDDGSDDGTPAVAQALAPSLGCEAWVIESHSKAKTVAQAKNRVCLLINERRATHPAITFADADDETHPDKFKRLIPEILTFGAVGIRGGFITATPAGQETGRVLPKAGTYNFGPWATILHESLVPADGRLFPEDWPRYEDSVLWARWEGRGIHLAHSHAITATYYQHPGSVSRPAPSTDATVWLARRDAATTLDRAPGLPVASVGILTLLAGRYAPLARWVESIWQLRLPVPAGLYLVDNSGSPEFSAHVQRIAGEWRAAGKFTHVTVIDGGQPYKAQPGETYLNNEKHSHIGRLYDAAFRQIVESSILTIEDDVIVPADALKILLQSLRADVGAVAGCYEAPNKPGHLCGSIASDFWDLIPLKNVPNAPFCAGFVPGGCTLYRTDVLAGCLPIKSGLAKPYHSVGWDSNASLDIRLQGKKLILDGRVQCDHLSEYLVNRCDLDVWKGWGFERPPGIQVIITAWNVAEYIPRCLASVERALAGYRWVLILADDGSTDETFEAFKAHKSAAEVVIVERFEKAETVSIAKNRAIRLGKKYRKEFPCLCFMDADDEMPETRVRGLLPIAIGTGSPAVVGSWMTERDGQQKRVALQMNRSAFGAPMMLIHADLVPWDGQLFPDSFIRHGDLACWHEWKRRGINITPAPDVIASVHVYRLGSVSHPVDPGDVEPKRKHLEEYKQSVDAKPLLSFCTAVMDRLDHAKRTFRRNVDLMRKAEDVEFCVVDYNSGDGFGSWLLEEFADQIASGRMKYARTDAPKFFNLSHAKNCAHRMASGIFAVNLDADNYLTEEYVKQLRDAIASGAEVIRFDTRISSVCGGGGGRVAIRNSLFQAIGGYDEEHSGWGAEDEDCANRGVAMGGKQLFLPPECLSFIEHDDDLRLARLAERDKAASQKKWQEYFKARIRRKQYVANEGRQWGRL